mmetsp:Transcript_869/g.1815  ORF Transcript_869/g.1815 Transcript_869/m.1815 type:complete len:315 (-) Transcript_869:151-1095(-)
MGRTPGRRSGDALEGLHCCSSFASRPGSASQGPRVPQSTLPRSVLPSTAAAATQSQSCSGGVASVTGGTCFRRPFATRERAPPSLARGDPCCRTSSSIHFSHAPGPAEAAGGLARSDAAPAAAAACSRPTSMAGRAQPNCASASTWSAPSRRRRPAMAAASFARRSTSAASAFAAAAPGCKGAFSTKCSWSMAASLATCAARRLFFGASFARRAARAKPARVFVSAPGSIGALPLERPLPMRRSASPSCFGWPWLACSFSPSSPPKASHAAASPGSDRASAAEIGFSSPLRSCSMPSGGARTSACAFFAAPAKA